MSWTEEKVTKLKELWGKGNTASQIAEIIGGISRNAVIGKAHRLNLSAKIKTRAATSNKNFEINTQDKNLNNRKWFNLDNSSLQSKLKKSPQIIGYVIENTDISIKKYYDPYFLASRDNYKWQFAMPTFKNNILDSEIIEAGIIPSLISWKSDKPVYQMKKNQFELISFEIWLSESQQHFNTFFKTFGQIEYVSVSMSTEEHSSIFKLKLKDNLRDIVISF